MGALVVHHAETKQIVAKPIRSKTAVELTRVLKEVFLEDIPVPRAFRVDGEKGFNLQAVDTLLSIGVTDFQIAPPRTHTANGEAENAIRRLIEAIRMAMHDNSDTQFSNWSKYLPAAVRRLNAKPDATGVTPHQRVFGVNPHASTIRRILQQLNAEKVVK